MSYEMYREAALNELNMSQLGTFVKNNATQGAVGDYAKLFSKDPTVREKTNIFGLAGTTASMYRNFNAGVDQAYKERKEQLEARQAEAARKKADLAEKKLAAEQKRSEQLQSQMNNENSIFDNRTDQEVLDDWDEDEEKRLERQKTTEEALKAAAMIAAADARANSVKRANKNKVSNEAFDMSDVRGTVGELGSLFAGQIIQQGASKIRNAALNKGGYYLTKAQFALADKKAERQRQKEAEAQAQQLKLQNKQMKEQQALAQKQKADMAKL